MPGPRILAIPAGLLHGAVDGPLDHALSMRFDTVLLPRAEPPPGERAALPPAAWVAGARARGLAVLTDLWPPDSWPAAGRLAGRHPVAGAAADPRPQAGRARLQAALADGGAAAELRRDLAQQIRAAADAGVTGLLCRRAHWLPASLWQDLLSGERGRGQAFLCEALGAPPSEILDLSRCGFDQVLNSACWWDFQAPWLLEQQRQIGRAIPTISFPQFVAGPARGEAAPAIPPDGAALTGPRHRTRYLFAAVLSSGVMMPLGYAAAGEADWIAAVNALKAACPALQGEGTWRRLTGPDTAPVLLLRSPAELPAASEEVAALAINPTAARLPMAGADRLGFATGGAFGPFRDITPPAADGAPAPDGDSLEPFGSRLLVAGRSARRRSPAGGARETARRMRRLAEARIAIEAVAPEVDGGRFAAKRVAGETVAIEADIFCDGHDRIAAAVKLRGPADKAWRAIPMQPLDNDRWRALALLDEVGRHRFVIEAWRDLYASWRHDTLRKREAGQSLALEAQEGLDLLQRASAPSDPAGAADLAALLQRAEGLRDEPVALIELLTAAETASLMAAFGPRANATVLDGEREIYADRSLAACGAWYELMPRSQSGDAGRHGTFDDVIARLPEIRDLGFDILYFPPIHPIGRTNRKGRNNSLAAAAGDPGSPYAIGAAEGGHDAVHPELGSLEDFRRLVAAARRHGLEVALDFAIQCSPDHPWIREHPEWFDWRPDGSIKYAENPPKKYEDIVNLHFYRDAFPGVWLALRDVVLFWVAQGVTVFRVDNPHTKPLPFWEWLIREVQDRAPEAVFLAEAFTRPKLMKRLAKVGFTQSYSYFTWRNTKAELVAYLTELTQQPCRDYMRPNFFTNTPDINPVYLQTGGRAAFQVRLAAAALLSPVYGIYSGFELCEAAALPGKEEYLDSEKYEIRAWDWHRPGHIRDDVALLNRIRRENPALWQFANLEFLNAWNDQVLVFCKITGARDSCILAAINLDPHSRQTAAFEVPLWRLGLPDEAMVEAVDLVHDRRFSWTGKVQTLTLDPQVRPYAVWRLVPPPQGVTP